ncbi:bifunctional adenosylcobinamide kinase/adenosylcobinamide-phosphate guanylyltransferase [Flavobacterium sp. TR2]|uniref:bifunctional adenosylcobinamide kinase/adenosylcobinamide-phosphate guanylyltransferase n=1 Tax=Flavobacterium sp. TR2 TaxID=2977321 RepID=UPI0021B0E9F0|nr:bifunctional adenosylcobinamide kinase/adenosylcobinamide-phosphate guanylyltransferase [Flavobacterium sp. TR2]UWY28836.1 bifunctional adenosylcobinamide kinase/adenosylcobinamide-phosphate guanylyltransferase [Flavobacterium sp. TR2]
MEKFKRALTVANILSTVIPLIKFTGRFNDVFGNPQKKSRWFIWGDSSSGKSSFIMQLIKEFAKTEKTILISKEEDLDDENLQDRLKLFQMQDVANNFNVIDDNVEQLINRLEQRNSAQVVVIDSVSYFFLGYTFEDYLNFRKRFKEKTLVFIGHAKGQNPKTDFEDRIKFDATQKVVVSGYLATNKGRKYGPNAKQFVVWQKGYEDLHGTQKH